MHALEVEVDEKIQDAIRNAEAALQQAVIEIQEVTEILGDHTVLLENARIAKEGFTAEEQARINENVAKQQELQGQIEEMETKRHNAKKFARMQTDEIARFKEFRSIKVTRQTTFRPQAQEPHMRAMQFGGDAADAISY